MECSCAVCVLDAERGRGESDRSSKRARSQSVPTGVVVTHMATDAVRFRCPHLPGCGGCDVHIARDIVATEEELRATLPRFALST